MASQASYTKPPYGQLAKAYGTPLSPDYTPYPNATYNWTAVKYGYVVATPNQKAKQWMITHRDRNG